MNAFDSKLDGVLQAEKVDILQVNVGLTCNQACTHCHLECSPERTECMSWDTMEKIIRVACTLRPSLMDITGGAPELNPNLKRFVAAMLEQELPVQVRTNLTVMTEDCCTSMPRFFADNAVKLVASLPCYLDENVCKMRGSGSFEKSLTVFRELNALGYGSKGGPIIDLVFNHPLGPYLPPDQCALEADYKRELQDRYGVVFNRLLTITNIPIGRYMQELKRQGKDQEYMELLVKSFNLDTVPGLMCRHQVNIGWDGMLYDCDFNQALNLPIKDGPATIDDFDAWDLALRNIATGQHCFGCTAGAGSSCGGALA
ncbi:MAG: arsenosugar biosynthesis radical SAM protein ArsS [Proteobacteria bacterium]|nr:arsenosugar biosynthesis radical SAM protein ArsS [Pseudomonadota bacterium]